MAWQAAVAQAANSAIMGGIGMAVQKEEDQKQRDWQEKLQREFAENGIRWKVEDAKRAGIHPLYALGANTHSFSPVSVGGSSYSEGFREMGQNINRGIDAAMNTDQKELNKLSIASAKADLDGKVIENQIKASELARLNSSPTVGVPAGSADNFIPGQGNSGPLVKVKPMERTASQTGRLAQEAGWRPDVAYSRTDTGLTPVVPETLAESMEDDIIGKIFWRIRNQLVPNFSGEGSPAKSQLPKGKNFWGWNHLRQEWQPRRTPETVSPGWAPRGSGKSLKY